MLALSAAKARLYRQFRARPNRAAKRWIHAASTEAAQPQQAPHRGDYERCPRMLLRQVPALALNKARQLAGKAGGSAGGGGEAGLESAARLLTAAAVRVHPGWAAKGASPGYDGELQRKLVAEELGDYLGPEALRLTLTPPPPPPLQNAQAGGAARAAGA